MSRRQSYGYTLLELLLSVSAVGILAGIGASVYQSFVVRNDLDIATVTMAQTLRRAQTLARASDGDIRWGVHLASGNITLFQGSSYATRNSGFDEIFDISGTISISGDTEIVYSKFTGMPVSQSSTTLTSSTNQSRVITVNSLGMVNY